MNGPKHGEPSCKQRTRPDAVPKLKASSRVAIHVHIYRRESLFADAWHGAAAIISALAHAPPAFPQFRENTHPETPTMSVQRYASDTPVKPLIRKCMEKSNSSKAAALLCEMHSKMKFRELPAFGSFPPKQKSFC